MPNRRYNKQVVEEQKMGGGNDETMRSGYYPSDMGMEGGAMYKKGGSS